MLDIKALEQALSVIGDLGRGEITFDVRDVPVTMRALTADEEALVQRYARDGGGTDGEEDSDGLTLLERYKRATLSYAIVQVGSMDFRNEEFISTGEVTEKGVPVRLPKHRAIRKIIDSWARVATLSLFQKYLELITRIDAEAERAVKFDTQDLDREIARAEKRVADLKAEKERAAIARGTGSPIMLGEADKAAQEQIRGLMSSAAGRPPEDVVAEPEPDPPSPQLATPPRAPTPPPRPQAAPPVVPVRQRVVPPAAAPPAPPPPVTPPAPVHRDVASPEVLGEASFEGMLDSLGDSPEALAAETARLQSMRAQARRMSLDAAAEAEQGVIPASPARRLPPHLAASNVAVDMGASALDTVRRDPAIGDKEVYRLGTTPILDRARPPVPVNRKVPVNEKPKDGPTNPRYRPPGR